MDNLIQYLLDEKENLIKEEGNVAAKIDKLVLENEQIEIKITELIKGVDTTFEIFSPNSMDSNYNVAEINKLKTLLADNESLLKSYEEKKVELKDKLTKVYEAITVYERMQGTEHTLHGDISQHITEKRIETERLSKIAIEIAELEEKRYERILLKEMNPIIDSLIHKGELCDSFILQDINRSKMELSGLKEGLNTLKNKTENYMFHVKHSVEDECYSLGTNIEKFIQKYQDGTTIITFTKIGEDIQMSHSDIINNIKILYEIINNAINHGGADEIQIHLYVEVTDRLKKRVNLTVHDNGCGFNLEEVNTKDQFGLNIIKNRVAIYHGDVKFESNRESGTTISIQYE